MPQIFVTAGDAADLTEGTVVLRERISQRDFESDRFAANLIERLGWAVGDATDAERAYAAAPEAVRAREDRLDEPKRARELVNA